MHGHVREHIHSPEFRCFYRHYLQQANKRQRESERMKLHKVFSEQSRVFDFMTFRLRAGSMTCTNRVSTCTNGDAVRLRKSPGYTQKKCQSEMSSCRVNRKLHPMRPSLFRTSQETTRWTILVSYPKHSISRWDWTYRAGPTPEGQCGVFRLHGMVSNHDRHPLSTSLF